MGKENVKQSVFIKDSLLYFESDRESIKIYLGIQLLFIVNLKSQIEVRRAVVQLLNIGLSQRKVSEIFSLHRNTVRDWYNIFKNEGIESLNDIKPGPKKITAEIEGYIIAKFKELNFARNYKKIISNKIKEHFNVDINWTSVPVILKKHGIDLSVKKNNKKLEEEKTGNEEEEKRIIEDAGLFLVLPFLKGINLNELFFGVKDALKNNYFKSIDYVFGLILFFASGMIRVEENIKNYSDKSMGAIIGKNNLPSLRSYRKNLSKIISNTDLEEIQLKLCRRYFENNKQCNEIYIDGHFMPYHGTVSTFKGYNPIRRFAEKGRVAYFLNNNKGRPFFFILSDCYKDFREYLMDIVQKLPEITGKKSSKDILMVFDRGGYGMEFCKELSNYGEFICWKTGKLNMPGNSNWQKVMSEHQGNNYGEVKKVEFEACEIKRKNNKKVERDIWIKRGEKISSAFSNNENRSLDELVTILTKRWAMQENVFKPLKDMGIDKISSYIKEIYPENWLLEEKEIREVNNPEKIILKEKLAAIKNDIKKLKEKVGGNYYNGTGKKRLEKISNLIDEKLGQEKEIKMHLKSLPEKILITDLIKSKNIVKLNKPKKRFLDLMKVLSYNVHQDIVDFIRPVYKNQRDVNMFVRQILRKSGEIKISKDLITVTFQKFSSKIKNKSLFMLCEMLNEMNFVHPIYQKKTAFKVI